MDKSLIISKATDYILSIFGEKGLGFKKIGSDVSNAVSSEVLILWDKIKPFFIEDIKDEKLLKLLQENPTEERTKAKLTNHLYDKVDEDPKLETELIKLIEKFESESKGITNTTITQSHHGSGHNIGGDYVEGNKTKN